MNRRYAPQAGFTLLEVLAAVAIFAIVGALAMGGYNELVGQSGTVDLRMARVRAVQLAVTRIAQDFAELEPRPVRQSLGDGVEAALLADGRDANLVSLTRAGWTNSVGLQRPTLQRVTYRLQDGSLYRDQWPVLDRMLSSEPVTRELLQQVSAVRFRYMDNNRDWNDEWRGSQDTSVAGRRQRPLAVEITIDLEDWGPITRIVEVPG